MRVRRRAEGEIWLAAGASVILHLGLTLLPVPLPAAATEASTQLEINVVPVAVPEVEPTRSPGPEPEAGTATGDRNRNRDRNRRPEPQPEPEPGPVGPTEPANPPSRWSSMRSISVAPRGPVDVTIPGGVEGAPSRTELPPGALGDGPVRAPPPLLPGKGDGPLGPMFKPAGEGGFRATRPGFKMRVNRDGTVELKDRGSFAPWAGRFDWSDALMRSIGADPYLAEKRRVLDLTREARAEMAREDRTDRLREAVVKMPGYLRKIWAHPRYSVAEKRRIFFLLWDEVLEEGDEEMVAAGVGVRAAIFGFIRRTLPKGSEHGYSDEELAGLNARRSSKAVFAPY